MSAEAALNHPYFLSLGERVHQLEDSECPRAQGRPEQGDGAADMGGAIAEAGPLGPGEWSGTHGFPSTVLIWRTESGLEGASALWI